jgi:hypothetical protein
MSTKKREWWPIGIVFAMAMFIGGILFAVSIMVRQDVSLTSEDYYAKEIAYQNEIDKSQRGLSPKQKPDVKVLTATKAVEIGFPGRPEASSFSGKLTFFRPSDAKLDFNLDIDVDETGKQWVDFHSRQPGLWQLQIDWQEDGESYYFEQELMF